MLNETNMAVFDKYIRFIAQDMDDYNRILHECTGALHYQKGRTRSDIQRLLKDVILNQIQSNVYIEYKTKLDEEDTFMTTPFEIEEGVLECKKCNSKRTISFQRQTRSADEGSTTFAKCVECGNQWRFNN